MNQGNMIFEGMDWIHLTHQRTTEHCEYVAETSIFIKLGNVSSWATINLMKKEFAQWDWLIIKSLLGARPMILNGSEYFTLG